MFFILLFVSLIVFIWAYSRLKEQNNKIIEQNYLIISLLGEIKSQNQKK